MKDTKTTNILLLIIVIPLIFYLLKILSFIFLSSLLSNAVAEELTIPADKAVIQFDTKIGAVTFPHKRHSDLKITQCITCHHKIEPTDTAIKPCHDCHQHKSKKPAKAKTAFHNRCTGCHEYTVAGGQNAGPLKKKCKLCHIKPPKK